MAEVTKWRVQPRQHDDLLEHLCVVRGLKKSELALDFSLGLHDPNLLPGMKAARALIVKAKKNHWHVTVFGDYDADGTPAAALLSTLLDRLGLAHNVIIPTRADGYGLKVANVEKIAATSQLLIAVDTGVTAVEPIALAKAKGIEVIVLDHHLPKSQLPATDALVDPFLATSTYPFKNLCGCALAYKLAEALAADFPKELSEGFRKWLLDLVAISTVADMMVMKGENRVLVHYGLQVLRQTRRPGLKALMSVAGIEADKLSVGTLGFSFGPRLNASGRMGDNWPAFQLLTAKDDTSALEIAGQIERLNRDRQTMVEQVLAEAEKLIHQQNSRDDHLNIVIGQTWPAGVVGLVAGKLAARHSRPTIVLTGHGDVLTGSARSWADYSMIDGLTSQTKVLKTFGGHRQAAGLSLAPTDLKKFVDGIKAHAHQAIAKGDLVPSFTADAILDEAELTLATATLCEQLAPFGMENQAPLFIIKAAELGSPRFIGAKGNHVKWAATAGGKSLDIIGFGLADRVRESRLGSAHLLGHLEKNEWNNQTKLQLRLVDFQPTDHKITTVEKADG